MRLISIQFPALPMFGNLGHVTIEDPSSKFEVRGFVVAIRGPAVFLVSPPGWTYRNQPIALLGSGPRRFFEVARADCIEQWEGLLEDVDAVTKYTSGPIGTVAEVLSEEELERATAPKQKAAGR